MSIRIPVILRTGGLEPHSRPPSGRSVGDDVPGMDDEIRTYPQARRPLQAKRVPSLVADDIRRRIIGGELAEGVRLPKEDVLRSRFGVGRPAMREAMRILESEGLVTVLRGNQGGAIVRAPRDEQAAYSLALVLASRDIGTRDVGAALQELEPACAALCARRADRERTVLPELRSVHRDAGRVRDEPASFTAALRSFHETIVGSCGNETLIVVAGALEKLWSSHVTTASEDRPRTRDQQQRSLDEHERILRAIELGDPDGARDAVSAHIGRVQNLPTPANTEDAPIDISTLRDALLP